ncbi:Mitosis inhibitor protein kinase wee1 [Phytophthora pseudosyringae]|uniref:Mitosis inhibitor protein kinase wee1 n=1 Tax=Phytophthora pseudosyringae TaxID=221518 RepID=A0A8T1WCV3_9STRA|nr:Mitosis inhibitor protein kinase wee1 [Phytophthora pseudosyringae]
MLLNALRSKSRGSSQASSGGPSLSGGAKKQRSIHDFFSQPAAGSKRQQIGGSKPRKARRSLEASAKGNSFSSAAAENGEEEAVSVQKRIDYDVMDDESSEEPMLLASQTSESSAKRPRPKKIDFTGCSSQRSEPDLEPTHTPVRFGLPPTSQGYYTPGMGTPMQQYSQDDMDFLTPRDQPVIPLSNPTTPSPLKKRPRLSSGADMIQEEQVQDLTQDMTHMDVRHARKGLPSLSSQSSMDTGSPKVNVVVNTKRARPNGEQAASFLSEESYVNPFAPEPTSDGKKKISRRKRRSFPSAWVGAKNGSPVSKYLSDFSELGLIGSGSFSKVYKCIKKIDGWVYAVKKSKRHFRGKADTERALREVQALAALSDSNHVVRYFDAWIEDDLLYIQLENLEGCSLAGLVSKHAPYKVPEETLCKILCHLAQALYDMHNKKMVHMDVKLQNVLVGPGEVFKLGDLGTVAHLDGSMEITEGDNRYLSRELLEGNRNNLRAGDIFALGATIYELALGTTLASGGEEWQKIRDGDLVMFRQYSNSLQHLIASMMHPDALQRPLAEDILQHEVVLPFR